MELLYNNIKWDESFLNSPSDTQNIPYLKNPPDIIDISVGRQLFVDDFLIASSDLQPQYHKAKKFSGNPILRPEAPWENEISPGACPKSGGVWYDEEEKIFKMWYDGSWCQYSCYATSTDGIHWERPNLHIVEGTNIILPYKHGETDEILPFSEDVNYLRTNSSNVIIDYDAPKDERYKFFLRNPGWGIPAIIGVSADGINFKKLSFTGVVGDRSTIFYNPFRKKWVYSVRSQFWNGQFERSRIYYECDNFMDGANWNKENEHYWMKVDELDRPHPYIREQPQLYNVDCIGYESIMLGMFQILYGPDNISCAKFGAPKITELMPMYSRDGYHFSRPCRESIINSSMYEGAWDRGYVQSVGGGVIINGDELWIYYIGFAGDTSKKNDSETMDNGMYCNASTGLAKLRRDGFVSLDGDGILLTKKLTFSGKHAMCINAVGTVWAEILNEQGNLLAKSDIFEGDSTKHELVFERFDIAQLNGKVFRIRFHVNGSLYSFGYTDSNGDFGGARAAGIVK